MPWKSLLIGLGQIGLQYDLHSGSETFIYSHARALDLHPDFELAAAVDCSSINRGIFLDVYDIPCHSTLSEVKNIEQIDVFIIATPTPTHFPLLRELLGYTVPKIVLCEKPLSYNVKEAEHMLNMCEKTGTRLFVNYIRNSDPGAIEVGRRMLANEIALPAKGTCWYTKGFLHNASHFFCLLQEWLGPAQDFQIINSGRQIDEWDAEPDVRVFYENGEIFFLAARQEHFAYHSVELLTRNGRLLYDHGGSIISWNKIKTAKMAQNMISLEREPETIPSDMNRYQYNVLEHLASFLNGKKAHLCDGHQGFKTLKEMTAILGKR